MTDDRQRDGELVRRFVGGESRAFDELMRRHEDRVFAVCLRVMGDRELALDATAGDLSSPSTARHISTTTRRPSAPGCTGWRSTPATTSIADGPGSAPR